MINCYVVSAEGPGFLDKGNWVTHSILGCFSSLKDVWEFVENREDDDEEILLLTYPDGSKMNIKDNIGSLEESVALEEEK